jgi:protease secretion system outer membrane protein
MSIDVQILQRAARSAAWILISFLLLGGQAQAVNLGVVQAYQAARLNDPMYRAAVAEHEAGQEYQKLGQAQLLPSISASYANSRNHADVNSVQGGTDRRDYRSTSSGLQLRQPLVHLEGLAARRQGFARTSASNFMFAAHQQDLIVRVFEAYATALLAQEQHVLIQAQLTSLTEQLRANERMLANGEGTRTDVLETKAKHSMAQAQLIESRDNLTYARNKLAVITGVTFQNLDKHVTGLETLSVQTPPLAHWRALALEKNGLLQSLRRNADVAKEEINRVKSGHYPRLDLVASVGRSESDTLSSFQQSARTRMVGVQLQVPLYAGGGISAQGRQASALYTQALADLDAKTSEVMVGLDRQYHLLESGALRIKALMDAVESSRNLVEATRKSVSGGVRINMDVLEAQERLTQAERDLAQAGYTYLLTGLRLRQTAGVLTEDDLSALANRFGPAE